MSDRPSVIAAGVALLLVVFVGTTLPSGLGGDALVLSDAVAITTTGPDGRFSFAVSRADVDRLFAGRRPVVKLKVVSGTMLLADWRQPHDWPLPCPRSRRRHFMASFATASRPRAWRCSLTGRYTCERRSKEPSPPGRSPTRSGSSSAPWSRPSRTPVSSRRSTYDRRASGWAPSCRTRPGCPAPPSTASFEKCSSTPETRLRSGPSSASIRSSRAMWRRFSSGAAPSRAVLRRCRGLLAGSARSARGVSALHRAGHATGACALVPGGAGGGALIGGAIPGWAGRLGS